MGIEVLLDDPLDLQAHGFDVRLVNGHSADHEVVSRVVETPAFVDVEEDHGKKKAAGIMDREKRQPSQPQTAYEK